MIQNTPPPLTDLPTTADPPSVSRLTIQPASDERQASLWLGRVTSFVGALCLLFALLEWALRPGHLRTVLALLTIAMFAAILHSYTFEDGK